MRSDGKGRVGSSGQITPSVTVCGKVTVTALKSL